MEQFAKKKEQLKTDSQYFTHVSIYAHCVGFIYIIFSFYFAHSTVNKFNLFESKMCEKNGCLQMKKHWTSKSLKIIVITCGQAFRVWCMKHKIRSPRYSWSWSGLSFFDLFDCLIDICAYT